MIRINLLAEGRRPVAARPAKARVGGGEADLGQWLLLGLVVLALLVAGGYYLLLRSQQGNLQSQVAEAQKEVDELAPIIKEVEEFKARQEELQRRVDVISGLKANQSGPVRIMDEISRALPDLLWINRMEVKEKTITLAGEAFNTNAVASFIENLDGVAEFEEPVLKDTSQRRGVYSFVINFNYSYAPTVTAGDEEIASG